MSTCLAEARTTPRGIVSFITVAVTLSESSARIGSSFLAVTFRCRHHLLTASDVYNGITIQLFEQVLEHPTSPDFIDAAASGYTYDSLSGLETFGMPPVYCKLIIPHPNYSTAYRHSMYPASLMSLRHR